MGWGLRDRRRTEHAPEGAAVGAGLRGFGGSEYSTSDFSSDPERFVVAGRPRLALA